MVVLSRRLQRISGIIILLELTSGIVGLFNFRVIQNCAVPESSISLLFHNVSTMCECRNLCSAQTRCIAVTIHNNGNGTYDCHLAEKFPALYYDLQQSSTALTLVNKVMPRCSDPFKMTEFGCVYLQSFNLDYNTSRNSCGSMDAEILTLDKDEQTPAFWMKFKTLYSNVRDTWNFWVGVVNGIWLNGVPVEGLTSSSSTCGSMKNGVIEASLCSEELYSICRRVLYEQHY